MPETKTEFAFPTDTRALVERLAVEAQEPAEPLEASLVRLKSRVAATRAGAAHDLVLYGTAAIEPLCQALKDKNDRVRAAAAISLGQVGDSQAIEPLLEALRSTFPGKSPRRSRIASMLFCIAVPLAILAAITLVIATRGEGIGHLISGLSSIPGNHPASVRDRPAIVAALEQIAGREPAPQIREALSDLRDIAADVLQEKPTREASRLAA